MVIDSITKIIRKFRRNAHGAATVEFAIVAMSVMVFAPLIYDLGNVINCYTNLGGSVRAGIQYALSHPADNSGITTVIRNASGFGNNLNISIAQSCQCSGSAATCGSTCTGGSTPATYDTITVSYNVPTLLPYANWPSNYFPISRATIVRVQ